MENVNIEPLIGCDARSLKKDSIPGIFITQVVLVPSSLAALKLLSWDIVFLLSNTATLPLRNIPNCQDDTRVVQIAIYQ